MNYEDVVKLAHKLSFQTPTQKYYVVWLEDYEYGIDIYPEYEGQGYYLSGVYYYEGYENDYDF